MRIEDYSAFELASKAESYTPDSLDSAGAKFLTSVRDSVVEAINSGTIALDDSADNSDTTHEIADGAPDVYTHTRWVEFVDLGAYREEPETGEWPSDLFDLAGAALYQIAERLIYALIQESISEALDARED